MTQWTLSNGDTIRKADNGYDYILTWAYPPQSAYAGQTDESILEPDEVIPTLRRRYRSDLHLAQQIVPTLWALSL